MENPESSAPVIIEEEYMRKPTTVKVLGIIGMVLSLLSTVGNIYIVLSYEMGWRGFYAIIACAVLTAACAAIVFAPKRSQAITAFGIFGGVIALTFILNFVTRRDGGTMSIIAPIILLILFSAIKPSREYLTSKEEKERMAKEKAEKEAKKAAKAEAKNDNNNPMMK